MGFHENRIKIRVRHGFPYGAIGPTKRKQGKKGKGRKKKKAGKKKGGGENKRDWLGIVGQGSTNIPN